MEQAEIGINIAIANFLEELPRHVTFPEMACRVLQVFGEEHAWSEDGIRSYFKAAPAKYAKPCKVEKDPALLAFVRAHHAGRTLDELLAACRAAFPDRSLPGRSSFARFLEKDRLILSKRGVTPRGAAS